MRLSFFSICIEDSIEGENIGFRGSFKSPASSGKKATLRIEKDEMVGEVSRRWNECFDVKRMQRFAGKEVSLGYACFQNVAELLEALHQSLLVHLWDSHCTFCSQNNLPPNWEEKALHQFISSSF